MTDRENSNWAEACEMVGARLAYVRKIAPALNARDAEIDHLRDELSSIRSRLVADRNEVQAGGEFNASVIQAYINDIDAALSHQQRTAEQK